MAATVTPIRRNDPPLTPSDCIQMLDAMLRDGGCLDLPNASVSFDESWEEPDWRGDHATGRGQDVLVRTPSFVVSRFINGKHTKTAHSTLLEALRELEAK